jgi:hypothetical protein
MVQRSQSGLSVRGRGGAVVVAAVAVAVCRRVEGGGGDGGAESGYDWKGGNAGEVWCVVNCL